jgi:hypothetical protein
VTAQLALDGVAALPAGVLDEFECLYAAYPRKANKRRAWRAFVSARQRDSFEVIMAGLAAFEFDERPQFRPHAATWLNNDRWLEESLNLGADPWGLAGWYGAQPERPPGLFWVRGWEIEALRDVMLASGFGFVWRGDLDTLGAWLCGGFRPDSLCDVLAAACASVASAPRVLRFFERSVSRFGLRWHATRCEWVRG